MKNETRPKARLSRRAILQGAAGLAAMSALPAFGQSGFNWKAASGANLNMAMQKASFATLLEKLMPEFTELTGINVQFEQIPEQQFRPKLVMDLQAGSGEMDVIYISYASQKQLLGKAGWLEDLRPYISDVSKTNADFDVDDFSPAAIAYATQPDGRLDSLPTTIHYNLLAYNKELFAAKNLQPPKTFDEMLAAAKALHDPSNNVAGFVMRGIKNANTSMWTGFMLGYGADPIDAQGNLNTTSPEALEAAKLYTALDKDCGPAGVVSFDWPESQASFMQGQAAMFIDTPGITAACNDPAKSKVAGKVGYVVHPAGPKAHVTPMLGSGFGINKFSTQKDAAWIFLQWVASKENQVKLVAGGAGGAARKSAYPTLLGMSPPPVSPEWVQALNDSILIAKSCIPDVVSANEFRDVYGIALSNMLTGSDPSTELASATDQYKQILAQFG